jgi:transcriptional regulator with XRE-family HTH domain
MSSTECQLQEKKMFNNKTESGRNNICGENIAKFRKEMRLSQRQLAERLQVLGLDIEKNAIQRMESGQRFITDIEMVYLAKAFGKNLSELVDTNLL